MGLLDRLLGRSRREAPAYPAPEVAPPPSGQVPPGPGGSTEDERALERYRYLLRTAPPDQIEEAHAEAFAKLTPEQRQQVLGQLATAGERPQGDDPRSLARAATRAEVRHPAPWSAPSAAPDTAAAGTAAATAGGTAARASAAWSAAACSAPSVVW